MALDESHRHQLYDALGTALGPEPAATLMSYLPPVGWADVATKQDLVLVRNDLVELERRLELRLEATCHRLAADLRGEMMSQTRALFIGLGAMTCTTAALVFAAVSIGS